MGTPPKGASVTSGTVSAGTAITAGHVIINGFTFPAFPVMGTVALRVDQIVEMINKAFSQTGVLAVKVTSTTYKLCAGVAIEATLGASATVATFGFATEIDDPLDSQALLTGRDNFGSGTDSDDSAYINYGSQDINVKHAKGMGILERVAGADIEVEPAATPTVDTN